MDHRLTKDDIRGIMPPAVTPFDDNENLDIAAFRRELAFMLEVGGRGFAVGGSTGEGHALTADELAALCRAATAELRGRVPLLAGIISASTGDAIRRGLAAREAGADGLMVTPVIYNKPSEECHLAYFAAIWEAVGLPIMVYNVLPHMPVSPRLLQRLADIPGVIAVKESIGGNLETLAEIVSTLGDRIAVTWAQDLLQFPGYVLGAVGAISAVNTILPEHSIMLFDAVQRSDLATARRLHYSTLPVVQALGASNWPAGIKAALNLQGRHVGPARRPFIPVGAEQAARLAAALAELGLAGDGPRRPRW